MTGERIEKLRKDKGWTQEKLAEKLNVSRQTIYKWESGSVNPEVDHLKKLVKIFNTSFDYLMGNDDNPYTEVTEEANEPIKEEIVKEVEKEVVNKIPTATCQICGSKIYDNSFVQLQEKQGPIVKNVTYCKKCFRAKQEEAKRVEEYKKYREYNKIHNGMIWSYILGGIALVGLVVTGLVLFMSNNDAGQLAVFLVTGVCAFTFIGCLFARNNFVGDMFMSIATWGCVRFPGIIFTLDFDGLVFLITTKILFAILGFVLVLITISLALVISLVLSVLVYPYAIVTVYKNPQKSLDY